MACSDCNCQGIHTGPVYKLFYFIRLCILCIVGCYLDIILNTCQLAQLCFYDNTLVVCILNYLFCDGNILIKRIFGSIDHYRSESAVDTGLTNLEICAVIQMKCNRNII